MILLAVVARGLSYIPTTSFTYSVIYHAKEIQKTHDYTPQNVLTPAEAARWGQKYAKRARKTTLNNFKRSVL